jgi:hypothetical protein
MKTKADLEDLLDPTNQVVTAANSIGSAFDNAFQGVISGSESASQALSKMFGAIASSFAQMAAQILAKQAVLGILSAFGFGGGGAAASPFSGATAPAFDANAPAIAGNAQAPVFRAAGGDLMAGQPSIVGEHGPELFVPGMSGGIVSNNDLLSSTRSAIKGSGGSSGSSGDTPPDAERALTTTREALQRSYQNTQTNLENNVMQAQAASSSNPVSVTYSGSRLVFNDQEFVKASDIPGIVQAATQRSTYQMNKAVTSRSSVRRAWGLS